MRYEEVLTLNQRLLRTHHYRDFIQRLTLRPSKSRVVLTELPRRHTETSLTEIFKFENKPEKKWKLDRTCYEMKEINDCS